MIFILSVIVILIVFLIAKRYKEEDKFTYYYNLALRCNKSKEFVEKHDIFRWTKHQGNYFKVMYIDNNQKLQVVNSQMEVFITKDKRFVELYRQNSMVEGIPEPYKKLFSPTDFWAIHLLEQDINENF